MTGGRGVPKLRRFFSLTLSVILLLSTLLVGISIYVPNAAAVTISHDVGNLDINALTDFGRILLPLTWGSLLQSTNDPMTGLGFIGLVIDQANYNHTLGTEDIVDSFSTWPYNVQDDLTAVSSANMIIDDGTTQKSIASFQNTGTGTGDPNDILVNQTVWTVKNKDWAILQWTLLNLKSVPLTGVCIGLEVPLSQIGTTPTSGLGGDNGDDIDGYDAVNDIYWAQDDDGTTIGFGSAIISDPITHYHSEDYHPVTYDEYKVYWQNESWLYGRISAPNAVEGATPGNRTSTVGWNGVTINAGGSRTFTLVIAINDSFANMITTLKDAQDYHNYVATGFCITEFSDSSSGTQEIEVYNYGQPETNFITENYFFSVDGGATRLTGTWANNPLPSYEYAVFTLNPGETMGVEGDTFGLYQDLVGKNVLIDEVSYGQGGIAPDPLNGESVARRYDAFTASYTNEWLRNASTGPTWGAQNDVGSVVSLPDIVLNRVMFNPIDTAEAYIELTLRKLRNLNISGYRIVCDDEFIVPSGTVLDPRNRFYVLRQVNFPAFFTRMDVAGDNVYLYDKNGNLLDMVGWSSPHTQGLFMSRVPDKNGSYQGYDDTTSQSAGWFFDQWPSLTISEFYVNGTSARIEVYNPRGGDKFLVPRWTLKVESGALTGSWTINPIPSGGYTIFNMDVAGGRPGEEGDTICLYYIGSILIDEVSFGVKGLAPDPLEGESTALYWNNYIGGYSNVWTRSPSSTFGTQNDVYPIEPFPEVVLNEVLLNPSNPGDKFIELYYRGFESINITGWDIVGDTVYDIPAGPDALLDTRNRFYLLREFEDPIFFSKLNIAGDNVYLYNDTSTVALQDRVGWNSAHEADASLTRLPDGNGTSDGFNDTSSKAAGWVFDQLPTYSMVLAEKDQKQWGDPSFFVWYSLNITNLQDSADYIDIIVQSENGWAVDLYEADRVTVLADKETPPDGLPDTGLLRPNTTYQIWAKVYIPSKPSAWVEKTSIFAQASLDTLRRDRALLKTVVNPWVEPDAYIEDPPYPTTIYEKSAGIFGYTNETTVTLNATGIGYPRYTAQDVIFILDSSGSMSWNDPDPDDKPGNFPFPERVRASWQYVDNMTGEDRGGYVDFDDRAMLMVPLAMGTSADNYHYLKQDATHGLWCSDNIGGTIINPALYIANHELVNNGDPNHVKVEILLTDADAISSFDDNLCRQEADFAAANDIIIFTIGLSVNFQGPPGGVDLMTYIATKTGGKYFPAPDASALTGIFSQIQKIVGRIAGYNPDPGGEEVLVKFVLEDGIEYIDSTFRLVTGTIETNPNPDTVTFNLTNTTLEWNWVADHIKVWEYWAVRFDISSTKIGANVPVNLVSDSSITYLTPNKLLVTKEFPLVTINVLPTPMTQPYITNVTIEPGGVNITWNPVTGAETYEIYGGPSQVSLNLDLTDVLDTVLAPQIWWLDTVNSPVYDEYYYVVRAVDTDTIPETRSRTSNTGGYYKKQFNAGLNTFSLPLEPFCNFDTNWYTSDMNADYIGYMDSTTRTWVRHNLGDGTTNNIQMRLGEGYEVKFSSQTTYVFTGMPGAMINYDDDSGFLGFDPDLEAKSLEVTIMPDGNVTLTWQEPGGMGPGDWYEVYYSNTREGFFGILDAHYFLVCSPVYFGNNTATHEGAKANDPGARMFYMVVPFNAMGIRGASTYSIGIWTEEFLSQYDTFGIPLKLTNNHTTDWYCDNIPDTVGINYYNISTQRWSWHSTRMAAGAYDPFLVMTEGYQISTLDTTKFTFIGI